MQFVFIERWISHSFRIFSVARSAISRSITINTEKSLIIRSCPRSVLFTRGSRHLVITLPRRETKKSKDNPSFTRSL